MKKALVVLAACALAATAVAQNASRKYDIKSGVVTYETIMKMGDFEMKGKVIVSFDDFGLKECKETFERDRLKEVFLSDGKELYLVRPSSKKAFKRGSAYRGTELRVEWSEFGTEAERQSGVYRKLPAMNVAGKNCEVFEHNDGQGTTTRYGGWNKILLYMNLKSKDMESIQRAVKIEENATIAPDKFKVPAGYKVE